VWEFPCGIRDIKSEKRNEKIKMEKDLRGYDSISG